MGQRGPLPHSVFDSRIAAAPLESLTAPIELDEQAAAEWNRVVPELHRLGRISTLDRTVLILYCQAQSDYIKYEAAIRERGFTYETGSGQLKPRPELHLKRQAQTTILKCATELGFTPQARQKMNVNTHAETTKTPAGTQASIKEKIARVKKEASA